MSIGMSNFTQLVDDYERIETAIRYIESNVESQPSLGEIADRVGLSEFYFQRLFTRWAGISPKQFLQFLTKEHAKSVLDESSNLLLAAYQSGLSGPGRLHDLFITCEAVTPGEYKHKGKGLTITYGIAPSPFGYCLIAQTERGICNLKFIKGAAVAGAVDELKHEWANAEFKEDVVAIEPQANAIFQLSRLDQSPPLHLYLKGTNFQLKVWEALLQIPPGSLVTYTEIAQVVSTNGARAVGNAVGHNPIAYIIPCHRVIRKEGDFGNYRWGPARKKAMLGWEMAHTAVGAAI